LVWPRYVCPYHVTQWFKKLSQNSQVQTGSFVLRILDSPQYGLLATSMLTNLEAKAPSFWKWAKAVVKEESVNYIWDAKTVSEKTKAKWATPK